MAQFILHDVTYFPYLEAHIVFHIWGLSLEYYPTNECITLFYGCCAERSKHFCVTNNYLNVKTNCKSILCCDRDFSVVCKMVTSECKTEEATLIHSYPLCSKIQSFWSCIFDSISNIRKANLELDSLLIIFDIPNLRSSLSSPQTDILCHTVLFLPRNVPNIMMWLADLLSSMEAERLKSDQTEML